MFLKQPKFNMIFINIFLLITNWFSYVKFMVIY
jgi:hypothetical protein